SPARSPDSGSTGCSRGGAQCRSTGARPRPNRSRARIRGPRSSGADWPRRGRWSRSARSSRPPRRRSTALSPRPRWTSDAGASTTKGGGRRSASAGGRAAADERGAVDAVLAILQFDSTSVPLLERLLGEGRLPTLAGVRGRGRRYDLDPGSTPLFPSAAYPTLYSGVEIADHGIYSAFPWSPAEQRVRFMRSFPLPRTAWERLPAGRRALVVDPYDNWPPRSGDGVFVSGWQYRNRVAALERWSVPPKAHASLSGRFGAPPLVEDAYGEQPTRRLVQARRRLLAAPARVSAAVRYLLGRERFDLLWATFSAPHFAGHFLWGKEHPELEDTVAEVYEAVDAAIGEIVAALPGDTDAIVLSPIGMGPFTSRADMLPEVLEAVLGGRTNGAAAGSSAFRLRAAVPSGLRAAVASALPAGVVHELAARLYLQGVDWSRTRAVALPGEHNGYVRLNVRGRERDGLVEPGQVDELLDELAAGIATFRDEDGGE